MLAILQVRAAHKVVHDTEAPGAAGEVHLGPPEKYKGHTRPQEEEEAKYRWWGWRYDSSAEVTAFFMSPHVSRLSAVPPPHSHGDTVLRHVAALPCACCFWACSPCR